MLFLGGEVVRLGLGELGWEREREEGRGVGIVPAYRVGMAMPAHWARAVIVGRDIFE
jgi:hypothetical protein